MCVYGGKREVYALLMQLRGQRFWVPPGYGITGSYVQHVQVLGTEPRSARSAVWLSPAPSGNFQEVSAEVANLFTKESTIGHSL